LGRAFNLKNNLMPFAKGDTGSQSKGEIPI